MELICDDSSTCPVAVIEVCEVELRDLVSLLERRVIDSVMIVSQSLASGWLVVFFISTDCIRVSYRIFSFGSLYSTIAEFFE